MLFAIYKTLNDPHLFIFPVFPFSTSKLTSRKAQKNVMKFLTHGMESLFKAVAGGVVEGVNLGEGGDGDGGGHNIIAICDLRFTICGLRINETQGIVKMKGLPDFTNRFRLGTKA